MALALHTAHTGSIPLAPRRSPEYRAGRQQSPDTAGTAQQNKEMPVLANLSKATRLEELLFQLILGPNCQELLATMRKCGVDRRCCESMSVAG